MSSISAKKMQSQKTVARILTATTSLFVAHGYHGTSIAAIAKATGLTKGALYAHFAGKEDLLLALIKRFETCFLDRLIEKVNNVKDSAWDKLHCFFNLAAGFAGRNRELCLLFTIISAEFSGAGHHQFDFEFRRIYSKYARFLTRIVEEGKLQGIIDPGLDTHTTAYTIIAFHDGVLLQWQRSSDLLAGPVFVDIFRQLLFQGLAPRHSSKKP